MKKLVSLLLTLALLLSAAPAALAEEAPAGLAPMTTEEITLTYAARGQDPEITLALAAHSRKSIPTFTWKSWTLPRTPTMTLWATWRLPKACPMCSGRTA